MAKSEKKSSPLKTAISTIIYVVVFAFLAFTILLNISKKDNEITSFFGYTMAVVQTGSMVDGGFNVGDFVLIKEVNAANENLKIGDIIVFYYNYQDSYDYSVRDSLTEIDTETWVDPNNSAENPNKSLMKTKADAVNANSILVFHRIIGVYTDGYGNKYYETKGDSNDSADTKVVREDFVCAKYLGKSAVITSILTFIVSPVGLIVVILIPVCLIAFSQLCDFIKEIRYYQITGELLNRKRRISEVNTKKIKVANYTSRVEKIYLYDITPKEDKNDMAIILWDESVDEVLKVYKKDRDEYYEYLSLNFSAKELDQIRFLKIKADILLENPNMPEKDLEQKAQKIFRREKDGNS